ncbi:MAG: cation:proton antiporter [Gemmatimonadota bacterium]|nr:cation:proton antiporter [Gemmatimonadota bacterium]
MSRRREGGPRRRLRPWLAALGALWLLAGSPLPGAPDGSPARTALRGASGAEAAVPQEAHGEQADAGSAAQPEGGHAAPTEGGEADGHAAGGAAEGGHGPQVRDVFFVLIAMLVLGKLFGEIAERRGQPAVLGELLAGVALGGSMLGVIPDAGTPLYEIVHVVAEIGVVLLLFEIGLETDLKEMFRVGPTAAKVALVGVALPFLLGFAYWFLADPSIGVHPEGITLAIVAIFVGATLTATSVGITARVLSDLNRMHTSEARIIIGAAVIDDVLGIVILAVVSGLVGGAALGVLGIAKIFGFAVGFLVLAVVLGTRFAPAIFDFVDRMRVSGVLVVAAFCFALGVAALADLAGSAMIIGAFAAGLVLSATNQFDAVVERMGPVADIFTPIFFVAVGAPVNVRLFLPGTEDFDLAVLVVGMILTAVAIFGKLVAGLAVRRADTSKLIVGVGMVPRGEVGLIFASIGLTAGILSGQVYSAILIMVILSTFVVPPVLKVLFARRPPDAPESVDDLREALEESL